MQALPPFAEIHKVRAENYKTFIMNLLSASTAASGLISFSLGLSVP